MKRVLLVLLLVAACSQKIDPEDLQFRQGKEALGLEFDPGLPQKEVLEDSSVPLGMKLTNGGAYDIESAVLALLVEGEWVSLKNIRLNNQQVQLYEDNQNSIVFDLEGKDLNNPQGGLAFLSATLDTKGVGEQREEVKTALRAQACYRYRTIADATVCLDPDVYQEVTVPKPCEVANVDLESQGGPVAVTKVEVEASPDEGRVVPRFSITVENVGDGQVVSPFFVYEACSDKQLGLQAFNEVELRATLPGDGGSVALKCLPAVENAGRVKLEGGKDTVRCFLEEGILAEKGAFTTVVNIELVYGYTTAVSRDLMIKRP